MGTFNDEIWRSPASSSPPRAWPTPSQAKTVDIENGIPVATDGPFAESKESLAGFWIVDVADEARAIEFASEVVAFIRAARRGAPGRGRTTGDVTLDPTVEDLLRELAPQVLGTLVRRLRAVRRVRGRRAGGAARRSAAVGERRRSRQPPLLAGDRRVAPPGRRMAERRAPAGAGRRRPPRWSRPNEASAPERDDTLTLLFLCCHPVVVACLRSSPSPCERSAG